MEKEISSGAMLGIVLIALAAIIGLGFGVFAIAKGTANQGVTDVQENLEGVAQTAYTDFDQTIVTGTQVKSAYQNFEGKNVAVLIATQATIDNVKNGKLVDGAAGIKAAYGKEDGAPLIAVADGTTTMQKSSGKPEDKIPSTFINYNALLGNRQVGSSGNVTVTKDLKFDQNCYVTSTGYQVDSGKTMFNNIAANLSKSGMIEYLPTSARFQAYLVKDASGTTMGVAFEQISSK